MIRSYEVCSRPLHRTSILAYVANANLAERSDNKLKYFAASCFQLGVKTHVQNGDSSLFSSYRQTPFSAQQLA